MMQQLGHGLDRHDLAQVFCHKQFVDNAVSIHEHSCTSCCSRCMSALHCWFNPYDDGIQWVLRLCGFSDGEVGGNCEAVGSRFLGMW